MEFLLHGITSSFSKRILLTNARYKFLSELKKRSPVINVKNGTKVIGNNDMEPLITRPGSETGLSGGDSQVVERVSSTCLTRGWRGPPFSGQ